ATNQVGSEGKILRTLVWHSIALAAIVGLIVVMFAYVFKSAVPHGLDFVKLDNKNIVRGRDELRIIHKLGLRLCLRISARGCGLRMYQNVGNERDAILSHTRNCKPI